MWVLLPEASRCKTIVTPGLQTRKLTHWLLHWLELPPGVGWVEWVSGVGELRTKALTNWVTSECFLLAFKRPTFLLCLHTAKTGERVLWENKRGKEWKWVMGGRGRGTRGGLYPWMYPNPFFLPEIFSANPITGCRNSDRRNVWRGPGGDTHSVHRRRM